MGNRYIRKVISAMREMGKIKSLIIYAGGIFAFILAFMLHSIISGFSIAKDELIASAVYGLIAEIISLLIGFYIAQRNIYDDLEKDYQSLIYLENNPEFIFKTIVDYHYLHPGQTEYFAYLQIKNNNDYPIENSYLSIERLNWIGDSRILAIDRTRKLGLPDRLNWKNNSYANNNCELNISPHTDAEVKVAVFGSNGLSINYCKLSKSPEPMSGLHQIYFRLGGTTNGREIQPKIMVGYLFHERSINNYEQKSIYETLKFHLDTEFDKPKYKNFSEHLTKIECEEQRRSEYLTFVEILKTI